MNYHAANVEFRRAAQARALEYCGSSKKGDKEQIALDVVANRRFLRPCTISSGADESFSAWEEVDTPTVIQKTKQALRDAAAALRKDYVDSGDEQANKRKRKKEKIRKPKEARKEDQNLSYQKMRLDENGSRGGLSSQRSVEAMHHPNQSGLNGMAGASGFGGHSNLSGYSGLGGLGGLSGIGGLSGVIGLSSGIGMPSHGGLGGLPPGLSLQQLQQQQRLDQLLLGGGSNPALTGLLGRGGVGSFGSSGLSSMAQSGLNSLADPSIAILMMQQEREWLLMRYQRELLMASNQANAQPSHQLSSDRLMTATRGLSQGTSTAINGIPPVLLPHFGMTTMDRSLEKPKHEDYGATTADSNKSQPLNKVQTAGDGSNDSEEDEYVPVEEEDGESDSGDDE